MAQSTVIFEQYDRFRPAGTAHSLSSSCYFDVNLMPRLRELGLGKESRVLEIGPGNGMVLRFLQELGVGKIEFFDVCQKFRKALAEEGFFSHDCENLTTLVQSLADDSYDVLIAMDVFEHVERNELEMFLSLFRSKLKKGGLILGQVPNSSGLFGHNTFVADYTHTTPFNELSLSSLLNGCQYNGVDVWETKLPRSLSNMLRSILRQVVFKFCYLVIRIVGATPVRCFSHLIMFRASK